MLTDEVLRFSQSDAPAYRCAEGVLSFRELCARACRLAHRLAAQTAPGEPIAVCGHKQLLMPICLLACAIADRPYLPVDSSIPSARARRMLTLAGVGLVLSPGD
ncbi:MAG: AMP-binding protein, partial [Oscillospiraceae bacterium]